MIKLAQAIVVEGKYDKIKLDQIFDSVVVCTNGFGVFSDREKLDYIRRLAKEKGIIIFTDSDGAGLVIRNYLKGAVTEGNVYHAYIPEVAGKEKRKKVPGKAGLLGVEGIDDQSIIKAIMSCGAEENASKGEKVTKSDLYFLGLSGGKGSAEKRKKLIKEMGLPSNISSNALIDAINAFYEKRQFIEIAGTLLK